LEFTVLKETGRLLRTVNIIRKWPLPVTRQGLLRRLEKLQAGQPVTRPKFDADSNRTQVYSLTSIPAYWEAAMKNYKTKKGEERYRATHKRDTQLEVKQNTENYSAE
jgi:hypothetical protein